MYSFQYVNTNLFIQISSKINTLNLLQRVNDQMLKSFYVTKKKKMC